MVKKFFPAFLIIFVLVTTYSFYQKKYPAVNKIFKLPNEEIGQPTGVQPSVSVEKSKSDAKTIFLQVDQPKNNETVATAITTLIGKTLPNASVFVNEQELKADANGNFSIKVELDEGKNVIYIVAADEFGNYIEKEIIVNLETTL